MITNVRTYLAIAEEALDESERLAVLARRPKPDGEHGHIVSFDPHQRSLKNSLVAIVFSATHLESVIYIVWMRTRGRLSYEKHKHKSYERKLVYLGLCDRDILFDTARFRELRNGIVHERALEVAELTGVALQSAQDEAR
jgi:hypothetical protein